MTQLLQIEKQLREIDNRVIMATAWKSAAERGDLVDAVFSMKKEIKANRSSVVAEIGESFVKLIEQFNPITEADIRLAELYDYWRIAPKGTKKFDSIRKQIRDIEILFKMSELSK